MQDRLVGDGKAGISMSSAVLEEGDVLHRAPWDTDSFRKRGDPPVEIAGASSVFLSVRRRHSLVNKVSRSAANGPQGG